MKRSLIIKTHSKQSFTEKESTRLIHCLDFVHSISKAYHRPLSLLKKKPNNLINNCRTFLKSKNQKTKQPRLRVRVRKTKSRKLRKSLTITRLFHSRVRDSNKYSRKQNHIIMKFKNIGKNKMILNKYLIPLFKSETTCSQLIFWRMLSQSLRRRKQRKAREVMHLDNSIILCCYMLKD